VERIPGPPYLDEGGIEPTRQPIAAFEDFREPDRALKGRRRPEDGKQNAVGAHRPLRTVESGDDGGGEREGVDQLAGQRLPEGPDRPSAAILRSRLEPGWVIFAATQPLRALKERTNCSSNAAVNGPVALGPASSMTARKASPGTGCSPVLQARRV